VDLPEATERAAPWNGALPHGKKALLYLGRLHPKKGLMNLLGSWSALGRRAPAAMDEWSLIIAGWDQGGHERELKSRAKELGIDRHVVFAGPLFEEAKAGALQRADGFVLPSFSEGLPMAVLEAWSYGKPVLMTPACNLGEGVTAGAAIEVEPDENSLTEGLGALLSATDEQRADMGRRGLELVKRKFTWPQVAAEMHAVYRWLAGGGSPPACVVKSR
jgi:poly(glycerol-phosphate) alpha-glucosyltransferase